MYQEYLGTLSQFVELHQQLQICLKNERTALVELKTDALFANNQLKEQLLQQLVELNEHIKALKEKLDPEDPDLLYLQKDLQTKVTETWEQTKKLCEQNRRLIEHSLKNLSIFSSNLMKLFGEKIGYSAKGESVSGISEGAVVEAQL